MGREFNNKLLVALSAIGSQLAALTEETADAIEQLLGYVATYPYDGILFRKSDMILAAHAGTQALLTNQKPGADQEHIYYSQKMTTNQNSMDLY